MQEAAQAAADAAAAREEEERVRRLHNEALEHEARLAAADRLAAERAMLDEALRCDTLGRGFDVKTVFIFRGVFRNLVVMEGRELAESFSLRMSARISGTLQTGRASHFPIDLFVRRLLTSGLLCALEWGTTVSSR